MNLNQQAEIQFNPILESNLMLIVFLKLKTE